MGPLLEVRGLKTHFFTREGVVKAVDGVDLTINEGDIVGLVGESGCGKSVTALSIMRLVPEPGRIVAGEIVFRGKNLLSLPEDEMRAIRGKEIAMVFQNPSTSLNPIFRAGFQVAEAIQVHEGLSEPEAQTHVIRLFERVEIPEPDTRSKNYPHELSGGMKQRVMIAMAVSCRPKLLIADEPTTALDVTIQAQILELMKELKEELGTAILLITHDLGIVAEICDIVAVMYAGKIAEVAPVEELFSDPKHPYTQLLLSSIPRPDKDIIDRLKVIRGVVPDPLNPPKGCRFVTRCPYAMKVCGEREPAPILIDRTHKITCFLYGGEKES
jgi:oligopeptide/dipeptide ABC transporter ATP-binding protein